MFVDTGDVEEVRKAAEWGILDGVTMNPTLIAKSGKGFRETVLKIASWCQAVRSVPRWWPQITTRC